LDPELYQGKKSDTDPYWYLSKWSGSATLPAGGGREKRKFERKRKMIFLNYNSVTDIAIFTTLDLFVQ
jgi:hypothetical protein